MKETKTFRPVPGLSREEEEKQLARIIGAAQDNLERMEQSIGKLSDELHDLMETYGTKDKEALLLLYNTQSQLRERSRDLLRCQKARIKPYFGRIDFKDPNIPWEESYYVGRVGISENGSDPVVIDWRAPLASVYYENSIGLCEYTVKNVGTQRIDLRRKRTYEIAEDRLKDFFDSDVVAKDELLNKYLAKSKKAVLGEIIATIQKEQNEIIRKSPKTNLIVQGVAGSGKTTVAMHRISYILYNYEKDFRPEDFYIIGSNRILLNYITSVLPDLDVYGVRQMTMEQLFVRLLYEDWEPGLHQIRPVDRMNPAICIKGGYEWFCDLEQFCEEYERAVIPRDDVRIEKNGVLLLEERAIRGYLENNKRLSLQEKAEMLNKILLSKLENELTGKYVSYTEAEREELKRTFRWHFGKSPWKGSIFSLYQGFLKRQEENGKAVPFAENMFDLYDLAALAYLYRRIKETDGIREASHVIIDEAQDFGMMAYGTLEYCLSDCTYTIMGDVSQNIHYGYGLNDWEELRKLILKGAFDSFCLLKKSYRNTVEISEFAINILRHGNFSIYPAEPILRHGTGVCVSECRDEEEMLQEAAKTIAGWQKEGHETIAVICRDEEEAALVSKRLGERMTLADSNLETAEFGNGIMVLPVEYTKGLEFDAVLIYHPSSKSYPAEDRYVKLLYVAATRALHELKAVHLGDLTALIGTPADDKKRMESLERTNGANAAGASAGGGDMAKGAAAGQETAEEAAGQETAKGAAAGQETAEGAAGQETAEGAAVQETAEGAAAGQETVKGAAGQETAEGAAGQKTVNGAAVETLASDAELKSGSRRKDMRKTGAKREAMMNPSLHRFWDCPDNRLLRPKNPGCIDGSIRTLKKTKRYLDLTSSYGTLRLTPIGDAVVRVQFIKGAAAGLRAGYWDCKPDCRIAWKAREGKTMVEAATEKLVIRVDKRSGALAFFDRSGKLLLAEKTVLPRQIESGADSRTWVYFDWQRNEKLSVKGMLPDELERVNQKARYISFGGKSLRMPLVVSDYGYGIGVAAERTVMCCAIPMYGPYLYTDGTDQIDYYFLYGGNYKGTLELYKRL